MIRIVTYMLLLVVFTSLFSACSWQHASKPNVIIILSDDQGWGDVGFNGNEMIHTPVLDSLSQVGVVLDRFYVSPVCAPTRSSLLTGKYHLATGTSWVTHRKEVMRESEITLAEVLRDNGYQTAYFGKWHNGHQFPHNALGQGFNQFFGFSAGHCNSYFDAELEYNHEKVATKGYIANVLTDSLLQFIAKSDEPFFAYMAYNTPHTPYQVPDAYFQKYMDAGLDTKTASIYGMCENIDDNILRIQNELKKTQKHDNTIFIYMSDNGPNYVRFNGGYKGRKGQVDEGGVRVPFIINYPKQGFASRKVNAGFAAHIDVFPTLLDLCGIDKEDYNVDGESFVDVLFNENALLKDRKFYSHQILSNNQEASSVRTNDYLLTCYPHDTALYNLGIDPFQMKNIINKEYRLADSLLADYALWFKQVCQLGTMPEAIQLGHEVVAQVELPAEECELGKHLQFAGGMGWANDYVVNWSDTNDFMKWSIDVVKQGNYDVLLQYVCKLEEVGDHFQISCQNNVLNFDIAQKKEKVFAENHDLVRRDEVYEVEWGVQNVGSLVLEKGLCDLNLRFAEHKNTSIEVKGLVLCTIY